MFPVIIKSALSFAALQTIRRPIPLLAGKSLEADGKNAELYNKLMLEENNLCCHDLRYN
jgi:hypothetical protein